MPNNASPNTGTGSSELATSVDPAAATQPGTPGPAPQVAIVGGGPAGLMAAEALLRAGARVALYDAMPSVGRKFLLAGRGGLNITHSEPPAAFLGRYGPTGSQATVATWLQALPPEALRDWVHGLGVQTFVGSSGRVFPAEMKAAPLLRAWLHRLRSQGLSLHMRHRWLGWADGEPPTHLRLMGPSGPVAVQADAVVLALGGASWPQLGSDGAWWPWLAARGVAMAPLAPANCGFDIAWSGYFTERFAGAPMKSVRLRFDDGVAPVFDRAGEFVVTATGIEGSLVYAAAAALRDAIARDGLATLQLDLLPGKSLAQLTEALARGRGTRSLPSQLKSQVGLAGVKAALLRERYSAEQLSDLLAREPGTLAGQLKSWPLTLVAPRPVAEAISTAGGVGLQALDRNGMLQAMPGVFCAGEMLDWEAPTGGYLLNASLASGLVVGQGAASHLGLG